VLEPLKVWPFGLRLAGRRSDFKKSIAIRGRLGRSFHPRRRERADAGQAVKAVEVLLDAPHHCDVAHGDDDLSFSVTRLKWDGADAEHRSVPAGRERDNATADGLFGRNAGGAVNCGLVLPSGLAWPFPDYGRDRIAPRWDTESTDTTFCPIGKARTKLAVVWHHERYTDVEL